MITHINKVFKMQLKRNTAQKNVIMEELLAADHPTATELYGRIHQSHPKISRATVFRVNRSARPLPLLQVRKSGGRVQRQSFTAFDGGERGRV